MRFQIAAEMSYEVLQRSTMILNVHALRTPSQTIVEERLMVEPKVRCEELLSANGENRFVRLQTGASKQLAMRYTATVEVHARTIKHRELTTATVAEIDRSVIPYLFPSRYCQSDLLGRLAWAKFGEISHPYEKVNAVCRWIHENVEYLHGSTDSATSAFDTVTQRAGVCRDFAHLGIALCRALSIPARYFTGYAYQLQPPDFHACFEAHIGNHWVIFDATRLVPLNGLIRIATGRDAADASIATIFGRARSQGLKVSCEPADNEETFKPLTYRKFIRQGLSLEG